MKRIRVQETLTVESAKVVVRRTRAVDSLSLEFKLGPLGVGAFLHFIRTCNFCFLSSTSFGGYSLFSFFQRKKKDFFSLIWHRSKRTVSLGRLRIQMRLTLYVEFSVRIHIDWEVSFVTKTFSRIIFPPRRDRIFEAALSTPHPPFPLPCYGDFSLLRTHVGLLSTIMFVGRFHHYEDVTEVFVRYLK